MGTKRNSIPNRNAAVAAGKPQRRASDSGVIGAGSSARQLEGGWNKWDRSTYPIFIASNVSWMRGLPVSASSNLRGSRAEASRAGMTMVLRSDIIGCDRPPRWAERRRDRRVARLDAEVGRNHEQRRTL